MLTITRLLAVSAEPLLNRFCKQGNIQSLLSPVKVAMDKSPREYKSFESTTTMKPHLLRP